MIFKRNVPGWERGLRAACGIVLLVVAAMIPLAGWPLWAVLAGGAGLLVSALAGFCSAWRSRTAAHVSGLARIDGGLVAAAKAGDAAALDRLLAVSQPDLMRFARRTCANAEDAEDAVQAALWQLHRRIGTLRVIAAFASWLFRIVERECGRLLGLQRRTVPLENAEPSALRVEPVPSDLQARPRRHDRGPARPLSRGADPARHRGADGARGGGAARHLGRGGEEPPPSRARHAAREAARLGILVVMSYQHPDDLALIPELLALAPAVGKPLRLPDRARPARS